MEFFLFEVSLEHFREIWICTYQFRRWRSPSLSIHQDAKHHYGQFPSAFTEQSSNSTMWKCVVLQQPLKRLCWFGFVVLWDDVWVFFPSFTMNICWAAFLSSFSQLLFRNPTILVSQRILLNLSCGVKFSPHVFDEKGLYESNSSPLNVFFHRGWMFLWQRNH